MPLLADGVGDGIIFSGCPSAAFVCLFVCSFIWTDLVITISDDRF